MRRSFLLGLLLGITLVGCASFQYRYYGIVPSQGKLLGVKPSDDKPLSMCEPDAQQRGKCVVLFTEEFERFVSDYLETKEQLKACQSGRVN